MIMYVVKKNSVDHWFTKDLAVKFSWTFFFELQYNFSLSGKNTVDSILLDNVLYSLLTFYLKPPLPPVYDSLQGHHPDK